MGNEPAQVFKKLLVSLQYQVPTAFLQITLSTSNTTLSQLYKNYKIIPYSNYGMLLQKGCNV